MLRVNTAALALPRILRAGRTTHALLAFYAPVPHKVAASSAGAAGIARVVLYRGEWAVILVPGSNAVVRAPIDDAEGGAL